MNAPLRGVLRMPPRRRGRWDRGRVGREVLALLHEAASEVESACPWVVSEGTRKAVRAGVDRGMLAATDDLFAITPYGVLALARHDRAQARRALEGMRREAAAGSVMPWHVNDMIGFGPV